VETAIRSVIRFPPTAGLWVIQLARLSRVMGATLLRRRILSECVAVTALN